MKGIRVDYKKCSGCKMCEVACSLLHNGNICVQHSRVRVYVNEWFCLPVIAGQSVEGLCSLKSVLLFEGTEVHWCVFCRMACEGKEIFKSREEGRALRCTLCGECVKWCSSGALVGLD